MGDPHEVGRPSGSHVAGLNMNPISSLVCKAVVQNLYRDFGPIVVVDILTAIDQVAGIHTEISASQAEVETILLEKHGAFDQEIWAKVQKSRAWQEFHMKIYDLSIRYLNSAVDEVVQQELRDTDQ